jgi:hypothetical protein
MQSPPGSGTPLVRPTVLSASLSCSCLPHWRSPYNKKALRLAQGSRCCAPGIAACILTYPLAVSSVRDGVRDGGAVRFSASPPCPPLTPRLRSGQARRFTYVKPEMSCSRALWATWLVRNPHKCASATWLSDRHLRRHLVHEAIRIQCVRRHVAAQETHLLEHGDGRLPCGRIGLAELGRFP